MPCFIGTRYTRNFAIRQCSDDTPVDISSWEFRAMLRDTLNSAVIVTITTANGGFTIVDGIGGRLQITFSPEQTILFPIGRLMYNVERTDLVDGPYWLFEVTFQSKKPITRDIP